MRRARTPSDEPAEARELRARLVHYLEEIGDVCTPRVKEALLAVPRHRFVPERRLDTAYVNAPLSIGWEQTISQPSVVAMMTEALDLRGNERVLEIGAGSGYQAAVLSVLVGEVYTIEIVPELGERARKVLADLGYANVHVRIGDGRLGWPEHAPFDRVILTAGAPAVPQELFTQLADGGILVAPVGPMWSQNLLRYDKSGTRITARNLGPVAFVPLTRAS
jgi:protein-L-isoaspartate(D-aspartate) O-methyltransferase